MVNAIVRQTRAQVSSEMFSMPLVNPASLFSTAAWKEAFNVVAEKAEEHGYMFRPEHRAVLVIQDLYFARFFAEGEFRGFKLAQKLFEPLGHVKERFVQPNDRNNEYGLVVRPAGTAFDLQLYEFMGAVCFSVGRSVASDMGIIGLGKFPHQPVRWEIRVGDFLDFLSAVERVLTGYGDTSSCRVFMRVDFPDLEPKYFIQVRTLFEDILSTQIQRQLADDTLPLASQRAPLLECALSYEASVH